MAWLGDPVPRKGDKGAALQAQRGEKIETIGGFPIHITGMTRLIMTHPGFPDSNELIYIDNDKGYLFDTPMTDSQQQKS